MAVFGKKKSKYLYINQYALFSSHSRVIKLGWEHLELRKFYISIMTNMHVSNRQSSHCSTVKEQNKTNKRDLPWLICHCSYSVSP